MTFADSIKIDSDERGFELHIYVDEEPEVDENGLMVINIHACAVELLQQVKAEIGPWWDEGQAVKAEMLRFTSRDFTYSPEDIDESGGYALTDPKHERFHSVHADLYDSREGK